MEGEDFCTNNQLARDIYRLCVGQRLGEALAALTVCELELKRSAVIQPFLREEAEKDRCGDDVVVMNSAI